MFRKSDTPRLINVDGYEVQTDNSVLAVLRDIKAIARAVATAAMLSIAACASTAHGTAAAGQTTGPSASAPVAPSTPPASSPPAPASGTPSGVPPAAPASPVTPWIPSGGMPPTPGLSLFRPVPDEKFVEWRGANSTNTLRVEIDRSRRKLFLATTPGAPFTLHAGCPPYWNLEMVGIPDGASPDDAALNSTITPRMPDRGTFDVTGQASTREGQVVAAGFDCVARYPDGREDRERLSATIASVGGVQRRGTGVPAPFPFRGNRHGLHGGSDEESSGGPVFAEVAAAVARPIKGPGGNNPALDVDVGVDPVNGDNWHEHGQVGGRFRAARASEKIDTVDDSGRIVATGGEVVGNTFCGFLRGAWTPEITKSVRAVFGGGPGVCHAQQLETGPNSDIPSATGVAGTVDAGIQVGVKNFGGKAGWEATFGGNDAFQTHGPFFGFYGRF